MRATHIIVEASGRSLVSQALRNAFQGRVESAIFIGPVARYHIRLENEQLLIVDQATMDGVLSYHVDDQLYIGWDVTSNVILSA